MTSKAQSRARRVFTERYGNADAPLRPEVVIGHIREGRRVRQHERIRRLRKLKVPRSKATPFGVSE
jgi:hypothetical protein